MSLQAFRSLVGRGRAGLMPTRLTGISRVVPKQRRTMGGGGGYPEGKIPQSMEAELFQGHSKHPEGWETSIYVTYSLAAVIWLAFLYLTPDTSIETWAHGEAKARLKLKEEQGFDQFEFGVHYNNNPYSYEKEWEKFMQKVRCLLHRLSFDCIHLLFFSFCQNLYITS
jgi:ESSS subunit of NADH:ubiquinone oxidoreductase (complex I)